MKNVIEPIVELLSDEKVTKVGAGLTSDIKNLNIAYTELCQKHMLESKNVLNLDQIAREKGNGKCEKRQRKCEEKNGNGNPGFCATCCCWF